MPIPTVQTISFREIRLGPWAIHGFRTTDIFTEVFGGEMRLMRLATSVPPRAALHFSKGLKASRRIPGRAAVDPRRGPKPDVLSTSSRPPIDVVRSPTCCSPTLRTSAT